jgi:hypothetical protein
MKAKSGISVRKAVEKAFNAMPRTFNAYVFCGHVRAITRRSKLMDGTILRRLREARADSLDYQYRCIDAEKSVYQKQLKK